MKASIGILVAAYSLTIAGCSTTRLDHVFKTEDIAIRSESKSAAQPIAPPAGPQHHSGSARSVGGGTAAAVQGTSSTAATSTNTTGSGVSTSTQTLKQVDLADLIYQGETDVDAALTKFRKDCSAPVASNTIDSCRMWRNSVQDRLVAASNAICREYKSGLQQEHANVNLIFGGASTVLGGVGAMISAVGAARIFSGASAISSGLRAEYNQDLYAMLATEVVTKAIDKTRADALKDIDARQNSVLRNYTLERAIADAIEYHSRCSLVAGLQEAAAAVSQSDNVGLKALNQTLSDLGQTAQIQIGKKAFQLFDRDTVFVKQSCQDAKAKYDTFIASSGIDARKADYKTTADDWQALFGSTSYCKDLGTANDVAARVDVEWQDTVSSFSSLTDDKERERVLGLVAAQQAKAKAIVGALRGSLDKALGAMGAALKALKDAESAQEDAKRDRPLAEAAILAIQDGDLASIANAITAIQTSANTEEKLRDKIQLTQSRLTQGQLDAVRTQLAVVRALDSLTA
jgi:hypothetical protein